MMHCSDCGYVAALEYLQNLQARLQVSRLTRHLIKLKVTTDLGLL